MLDLWPTDIINQRLRAPITILKEQAILLQQKSNGVINAQVRRIKTQDQLSEEKGQFLYEFIVVAPVLQSYEYRLFTISHEIELYPITLETDQIIARELGNPNNDPIVVKSEPDFIEQLRKIFCSKKTKKIINAMLAQSVEIEEPCDIIQVD
ncbi:MAG: hypothetical protein OMM_07089 [Candidatus Magnetoglobus multicellularis str. Araruama]|uniref:Uncharacterized protein n=1 Tax=Candidatus Magnetoglobus multicellularis str. Araruama TaxID=890399 RepID=A0A1V1PEH6_9BACT|nr:MAG: hypothetical protein OMM_07089 [Candidatus Magnetoglobus multicellularis str. Araruama]